MKRKNDTGERLALTYWDKRILVLGCGNVLFGDDGFGPEAAEYLQAFFPIPADCCVLNVGSSVREVLFNISISEKRPERVIIVDAVEMGRRPGEIFKMDVADIPLKKVDDFSMHQIPTSNMLKELEDLAGVTVDIWVAQVERIPAEVSPGLTPTLRAAIPEVCKILFKTISETGD